MVLTLIQINFASIGAAKLVGEESAGPECQHVICGALQSHHAYQNSALCPSDKRIFKDAHKLCAFGRA